jgi:hypothetical protein
MNPYVIIGLGVAWLASCGGAFWFGTSYEEGRHARQQVLLDAATKQFVAANQKFADDLGLQIATEFSGIKIVNRNITTEVHHEREVQTRVLENPDCRLPASTARLLNDARAGRSQPSAGGDPSAVRSDDAAARTGEPR